MCANFVFLDITVISTNILCLWRDLARKFHYRMYGYIYMISLFTYFWHAACWWLFYTTARRCFLDLLNKVLRIDWLFYFMSRIDWCRWLSINNDCLLMTLLLSTTNHGNHSNASNQTSHNVSRSSCKMPVIFVQLQASIFSTDFSKTPKFKNFTKVRPVGERCSMLIDTRNTDMAKPTVAFLDFVNASKIMCNAQYVSHYHIQLQLFSTQQ